MDSIGAVPRNHLFANLGLKSKRKPIQSTVRRSVAAIEACGQEHLIRLILPLVWIPRISLAFWLLSTGKDMSAV